MSETIVVKEICPTTTQSFVRRGALLVDVRERGEVEQLAFDVPALVHIPLSEFEDRFDELPKDQTLVMVCQVGARSLRATAFLLYKGWDAEKVVNMKHGMVRWVQKGFPVHGDPSSVLTSSSGSCCGGPEEKAEDSSASSSCCGGGASASSDSCC